MESVQCRLRIGQSCEVWVRKNAKNISILFAAQTLTASVKRSLGFQSVGTLPRSTILPLVAISNCRAVKQEMKSTVIGTE